MKTRLRGLATEIPPEEAARFAAAVLELIDRLVLGRERL